MVEAVRAKRSLGQHFLEDGRYPERIARFVGAGSDDVIVEIGPGTGALTHLLLGTAQSVFAIEVDGDLIRSLRSRFKNELDSGQLHLEHADVLDDRWLAKLPAGRLKLVGNLPYNIATRILTKTTDNASRFQSLTFMVQKEVALRVLAEAGDSDYGFLSVLICLHFDRSAGFDIPPGAFRPAPKVVSHVLRLTPRPLVARDETGRVTAIASLAFRHPRKMLVNNLKERFSRTSVESALEKAGLAARSRPGDVTVEQYITLARQLPPDPA